jgi:hypothetical protein
MAGGRRQGRHRGVAPGCQAECTIRAERALFERLCRGEENAMAGAARRGVLTMTENQVKILDGNTFVVSDERGDIEASLTDPTGLSSFDTRFLSRWVLTVDGQRLSPPLSADDLQYFETRFFLVPRTGKVYVDAKLSVIRHRSALYPPTSSSRSPSQPRSSSRSVSSSSRPPSTRPAVGRKPAFPFMWPSTCRSAICSSRR